MIAAHKKAEAATMKIRVRLGDHLLLDWTERVA
jgi:hypothetical protein